METPLAKSTPFGLLKQERGVRFTYLEKVEEKEENDQSVHIQFEEPPLNTLALFMSMLNQPHPITQYIVGWEQKSPTSARRVRTSYLSSARKNVLSRLGA